MFSNDLISQQEALNENKAVYATGDKYQYKTITAEVDQGKIISRMCEVISSNYATVQVLKADYIELKTKIPGESSASLTVQLDALIEQVAKRVLAEFEATIYLYK